MTLVRFHSRRVAILALLAGSCVAAVALAAPTRPRPKPPVAADAGSDNPYGEGASTSAQGASPDGGVTPMAADAGGPVPPPQVLHGEVGDGGVRPSPLNPAPNEFSQGAGALDAGASSGVDYDKLIADIASLRARVAAVGDTLFHSRIAIQIRTDGDHGKIGRLVVSLDDGAVYTAPQGFKADDWTAIYDHSLAPGHHAITVDVERKDERNDAFRNSQRSRFTVEIPRDQELGVQIKIGDDSDMGKDFPSDKSGSYDLRVRVKAEAHAVGKK
jgi:hypothetical protein